MKKAFILIFAVSILLLTACGKKEPASSASADTKPGQTQDVAAPTEEEQEVSENDFRIASLGDGRCEIVGCSATAKVIRVPEQLFGETVAGIAGYGFANIEAQKIILPDTVEYLDNYVFVNCNNLVEVDLGKGLKRTGLFSFNSCDELRRVTFPDGMEEMTECCFGYCPKLEEVYVPASVTKFATMIANPELCPNLVIVTPAGSAAEVNAQEYEIPVRNP